jgi:hypothetical protein
MGTLDGKHRRRPARPVLPSERFDLEIPMDLELIRIGLEESLLMAQLRLLEPRPERIPEREPSLSEFPGRAPETGGGTGSEARPELLPDIPPGDGLPRD